MVGKMYILSLLSLSLIHYFALHYNVAKTDWIEGRILNNVSQVCEYTTSALATSSDPTPSVKSNNVTQVETLGLEA